MGDNGQVMGMCNYCNELGRVYEQEDEYRSIFLVCLRCINDINTRLRLDDLQRRLRKRRMIDDDEDQSYSGSA